MLKLLFNQDGSIKDIVFPHYVTQGSTGELDSLKIAVAVDDLTLTDYTVVAQCKLPNGHSSVIDLDETDTDGYRYGYLTEAQTYYAGTLLISIKIINTNNAVLYTFQIPVTIDPTTYDATELTDNITNAQYTDLVKKLSVYSATGTVISYDTYAEANADKVNLNVGQLLFVREYNFFYKVYEYYDSKWLGLISEPSNLNINRATPDVTSGTITNTAYLYKLLNAPASLFTLEFSTTTPPSFEQYTFDGKNSSVLRYYTRIESGVKKIITINASTGEWTYSEQDLKQHLYKHILKVTLSAGQTSGAPSISMYMTVVNDSATSLATTFTESTFYNIVNEYQPLMAFSNSEITTDGAKTGILTASNSKVYLGIQEIKNSRIDHVDDNVAQII